MRKEGVVEWSARVMQVRLLRLLGVRDCFVAPAMSNVPYGGLDAVGCDEEASDGSADKHAVPLAGEDAVEDELVTR